MTQLVVGTFGGSGALFQLVLAVYILVVNSCERVLIIWIALVALKCAVPRREDSVEPI